MNVDLDFRGTWAATAGDATDLDFGLQQHTAPEAASATVHILLPPPAVRIRAAYNNLVTRKIENVSHVVWQPANWQVARTQDGWGDTKRDRETTGLPWKRSTRSAESVMSISGDNVLSRDASRMEWETTTPIDARTGDHFDPLWPQHDSMDLRWFEGDFLSDEIASPFVWLVPFPHHQSLSWQQGIRLSQQRQLTFSRGVWSSARWKLPWETGRQPRLGESHLPVDPSVEPIPPRVHPNLNFICRATRSGLAWRPLLSLNFGLHPCPNSGFSVPILKVYFVSNSVEVVRLPGREPIPVKSLQIGIDVDSWTWGMSATLPGNAMPLIEPTSQGPVEIEISINGVTWIMLVENYQVRREFGSTSLSINGRSRAAWLAEPYAPKRSFVPSVPFTARQLADNELTRPGLITGFSVDWQLADWLVPAGAVSFAESSPITVLNRIAEAAGGFVNAHPTLKQLAVRPRYPAAPWNWSSSTPDATLPLDVAKTLNLRWQEKPAYNAVFVAGEHAGVAARVMRAGTAGDVLAPMIVDPLITHAEAARARGIAILSDTGRQSLVTLELPMLSAIGLLSPGQMVAVGENGPSNTWHGLVRSTQITAQWSESLTVRQTIELERHYL